MWTIDLEAAAVPHFSIVSSMKVMFEQGIRANYFRSGDVREMFQEAMDYYVANELTHAIPQAILYDKYTIWFQRGLIPDEEVTPKYLTEQLRQRHRKNLTQQVLLDVGALTVEDPDAALTKAVQELVQVQFDTSTRMRHSVWSSTFTTRLREYADRVDAVRDNQQAGRGYYLGWDALTEHTWGIKAQEFIVFGGAPGTGKSWLMCWLALAAARHGVRTYLASLENNLKATEMRLDCAWANIPWVSYERGLLSLEENKRLHEARAEIEKLQLDELLIIDAPRYNRERSLMEIYGHARLYGAQLFIGDQLSWVTPRDNYRGDRSAQMSEIIQDIADLSKEYDMASIWASQFNRDGAKRDRPRMQDFALSTLIEQTADFAFSLYHNSEQEANEKMILEMLKARRSSKKAWMLQWRLARETFLDIQREYREGEG